MQDQWSERRTPKLLDDDADNNDNGSEVQDESWFDEATGVRMPGTVTKLVAREEGVVYLVGTLHNQRSSRDDVVMVIRAVQPEAVCIEMCSARVDLENYRRCLEDKEAGRLSACDLEGAVSEFKTARQEALRLRTSCELHLIDRPIDVTRSRLMATLSVADRLHLAWDQCAADCAHPMWGWMVRHKPFAAQLSDQEVATLRRRGAFDRWSAADAQAHPRQHHVVVTERDIYMCYGLQQVSTGRIVVAVVGLGHVTGIVRHFGGVQYSDVAALLVEPPSSLASLLAATTLLFGGVLLLAAAIELSLKPNNLL